MRENAFLCRDVSPECPHEHCDWLRGNRFLSALSEGSSVGCISVASVNGGNHLAEELLRVSVGHWAQLVCPPAGSLFACDS